MKKLLTLVFLGATACGVEVPAGLADKLAACPGMLKPEPTAVIVEGMTITSVRAEGDVACTVSANERIDVLYVGLAPMADEQAAKGQVDALCRSEETTAGPDGSCGRSRGGDDFTVNGVAGRYQVKIMVTERPVTEDVREAAFEIFSALRASGRGQR